jgi:hypothetical protein
VKLHVDPFRVAVMAEYEQPEALVAAARQLRDRGYERLDAYVPYPIEELEELVGGPRTRITWATLAAGLTGAATGYGIQWFCDTIDFPLNVGGRPVHPVLAFVPITFETTVLFAALTAFLGFFVASRMPEPSAPIFDVPGFDRAAVDRFWLAVDGRDPLFDEEATAAELQRSRPLSVVYPQRRP